MLKIFKRKDDKISNAIRVIAKYVKENKCSIHVIYCAGDSVSDEFTALNYYSGNNETFRSESEYVNSESELKDCGKRLLQKINKA